MEGSGFVFLEDLQQFLGVPHCLGVFWTVSDIVFKADFLHTCNFIDLSERHISLASQTLSFSVAALIV